MDMDLVIACVTGYQDRMEDMQAIGIITGYWGGYYTLNKKAKSLKTILQNFRKGQKTKPEHADDVNVSTFLENEKRFKELLDGRR